MGAQTPWARGVSESSERAVTPESIELLGSWKLLSVCVWVDGELVDPHFMGERPAGFIHYLEDGRVAVLIAERDRPPVEGRRDRLAERDRAQLYSTFTAYAGTYSRDGATVVHHLDMCLYPNDVDTDYVRKIELDGDRLVLGTEPMSSRDGSLVIKLTWERVAPRS